MIEDVQKIYDEWHFPTPSTIYVVVAQEGYYGEPQVCYGEGYFLREETAQTYVDRLNKNMVENHMTPHGPLFTYTVEEIDPHGT